MIPRLELFPAHYPVLVGISSCLLGHKVRYDGDHRSAAPLLQRFAAAVEWLPLCPEVGIGLGVPRPPIELVEQNGALRALGVMDPTLDVTCALQDYAQTLSPYLTHASGYIFKARSPSCGLVDTPIHQDQSIRVGRGLYAQGITDTLPHLPVTDEQCIEQGDTFDHFVEHIFCYARWQAHLQGSGTATDLHRFHAAHRRVWAAHAPDEICEIDEIAAHTPFCARGMNQTYWSFVDRILKVPASPANHLKVLISVHEEIRKTIPADYSLKMTQALDEFSANPTALAAVLRVFRTVIQANHLENAWADWYLFPDSREWRIRFKSSPLG